MSIPPGAFELAELSLGVGHRLVSRRPAAGGDERVVAEELQLDARVPVVVAQARVEPGGMLAQTPHPSLAAHCRLDDPVAELDGSEDVAVPDPPPVAAVVELDPAGPA